MPRPESAAVGPHIIDGKATAARITDKIAAEVASCGVTPGLAVVLVGNDPASAVYVRNKSRTAERCGFHSVQHTLPADTTMEELLRIVEALNGDPAVHGILVQLPPPRPSRRRHSHRRHRPDKDVDGLHVVNAGRPRRRRSVRHGALHASGVHGPRGGGARARSLGPRGG